MTQPARHRSSPDVYALLRHVMQPRAARAWAAPLVLRHFAPRPFPKGAAHDPCPTLIATDRWPRKPEFGGGHGAAA